MMWTRELRQITISATAANQTLTRANAIVNDVTAYNARANSPELTRILQSVQPKPAAH
jgi:hypothetical protein